jgi:outer membrane lipoprotein carrier protein
VLQRIRPIAAVVATAWLICTVGRAAEPTAADLALALQRKYSSIRDFSADFVSEYKTVLKKRLVERGTVLIKKPGRMRWDYKTPEEKQFVSDGVNIYSYIRQDRQVFKSAMPPDDQATTPMLFLAGKGDLTRDFTPSIVDASAGTPAGSRALRLTPKRPQPDYDWLTVTFDATTFALRALETLDAQGGTQSFTFTNWKENIGVADRLFVFMPPRGVDVITDTSR